MYNLEADNHINRPIADNILAFWSITWLHWQRMHSISCLDVSLRGHVNIIPTMQFFTIFDWVSGNSEIMHSALVVLFSPITSLWCSISTSRCVFLGHRFEHLRGYGKHKINKRSAARLTAQDISVIKPATDLTPHEVTYKLAYSRTNPVSGS